MSRRKQARPKSCKLSLSEDGDSQTETMDDDGVSVEDVEEKKLSEQDSSELTTMPDGDDIDDDGTILSDEDPVEIGAHAFHCETCNTIFSNLDQFMDHCNVHCVGVARCIQWNVEDRSCITQSGTSSSSSSTDLNKCLTARSSTSSVALNTLAPDQLPFSISLSQTNPYACHFCEKAFPRLGFLRIHEQVHADLMPFKCVHCQRVFRHKRSLDRHVKLHSGVRKYKCSQCDSAFARSDHLKSHLRTHDGGKPFQCPICNRGYMTTSSLASHMVSHKHSLTPAPSTTLTSSHKEYECVQCHKSFSTTKELQDHILIHSVKVKQENLQCSTCGDSFLGQEALDAHVNDIHNLQDNNTNLKHHQNHTIEFEHHQNSAIEVKCPICYDRFVETDLLCQHMEIHVGGDEPLIPLERPDASVGVTRPGSRGTSALTGNTSTGELLVCPYCMGDDYSSIEMLEIHMQSVHGVKPTEIYTCNYCNAPYPNLYSLHDHMNVVHRNQPCMDIKYPCSLCTKQFPSIEMLIEHKKASHTFADGGAPIIDSVYCMQCTLAFPNPSSLEEHMILIHSTQVEEKVKMSKSKNKRSWSKSQKELRPVSSPKHGRLSSIMASPEPVMDSATCDQCNATFHDLNNFQAHLKLHMESALTKFSCKQCSQQFPSEEQLENHSSVHYLSMTTEYGCTSCVKLFSKPDELQKHLMDIHAHHLYRCSLCKEIFDSKVNIQVHFAIKHSNECKLFKCTQCDNIFRSETEWQVHIRVNHLHIAKPYRCLFCQNSFCSEMDLQCHLTTHSKPFKCPMCSDSFHIEFLLDQHMQNVHADKGDNPNDSAVTPNKSKSFSTSPVSVKVKHEKESDGYLSPTGKSVNSFSPVMSPSLCSALASTSVWKSGDPMHICNICDQKFTSQALLQTHKSQDHGLKMQKSPETVLMEDFSTTGTSNLQIRNSALLSALTGDRQESCMYCSHTFKNKVEYEKHMRIHLSSENLKCKICDKEFPSGSILAEHKLQHCKIQQGNCCVVCKMVLKSEDHFYIHSQDHGYQGSLLQCIICRQTLASLVELQMHGKHHFQSKPNFYTCCVCLKSFDSKENLVSKLNTSGRTYYVCKPCYHGESSVLKCDQCSLSFTTEESLDVHKLEHKKQTFQCIKCQEFFRTEYEIQVHVATHMIQEGTNHECTLCSLNFDTPSKLQCHLIEHTYKHSEMRCSICCNVFHSASEIQSHALEHGIQARKYACSQCSQKFFFSAELENHMSSHKLSSNSIPLSIYRYDSSVFPRNGSIENSTFLGNGRQETFISSGNWKTDSSSPKSQKMKNSVSKDSLSKDVTRLQCPECQEMFSSPSDLKGHQKLHVQVEMIKCSLCSSVFRDVLAMQQHFFSVHSTLDGEATKTFQCSECDKHFPCLSNLQGHMRIHKTGAKFPCPLCSKTFALSRNLTIHMRSHSGEKPYECAICKKRFSRKENRKTHMKSHTGVRPFMCPVCQKSFTRKSHVREHMKQHPDWDVSNKLDPSLLDLGSISDSTSTSEEASLNGLSELSELESKENIEGSTITTDGSAVTVDGSTVTTDSSTNEVEDSASEKSVQNHVKDEISVH